jgi:hypothetical protein
MGSKDTFASERRAMAAVDDTVPAGASRELSGDRATPVPDQAEGQAVAAHRAHRHLRRLLGDSAGFMAVSIRASGTDDPALADSSYELLEMFSIVFGPWVPP